MKIIYAASKRKGASEQLNRFLKAVEPLNHVIKISAYKGISCIKAIDWNLDALLDIFVPGKISFENDNLQIYYDQMKYFGADLIISDLEVFTSHIATVLNIPVLQVSSRLLYDGLENKYNLGIQKNYSYLFKNKGRSARLKNLLDNSDCNFAYSHLCDIEQAPNLKNKFEYIRPYHILGKQSLTCQHNIVVTLFENDRGIIHRLKSQNDVVLFTNFLNEAYPGLILKNMTNVSEYACNLFNCTHFINRGFEEQLADGFYNNKYSLVIPDFTDQESVINSIITDHFKLGRMLYDLPNELESVELPAVRYNAGVKFLHERLNEF